jgi:hypothetical protein
MKGVSIIYIVMILLITGSAFIAGCVEETSTGMGKVENSMGSFNHSFGSLCIAIADAIQNVLHIPHTTVVATYPPTPEIQNLYVSPSATQTPIVSIPSSNSACSIVGSWKWLNGKYILTINSDRTMHSQDLNNIIHPGKWDVSNGQYTFNWDEGPYIDYVQLSQNCNNLNGYNNKGDPVYGSRLLTNNNDNIEAPIQTQGSSSEVLVRVIYSGHWQGSIGDLGSISSVDGIGSRDFPIHGDPRIVSSNAQKMDGSNNKLTIQIIKDGKIIKQGTTTAAYGFAQIATSV